MAGGKRTRSSARPGGLRAGTKAESYRHPTAESLLRPDVGTQAQFRKKKPPRTYRYDSSLSPELNWDGQNPARELGEWLLACIGDAIGEQGRKADWPRQFKNARGQVVAEVRSLEDAIEQLKRLGQPFLNWAGKAERLSFDVPTLPLFVHERLSTKAIIETLRSHRKDAAQLALFADPQLPIHEQVLRAYEHKGGWVNRLILGDSLVVMNSLLGYEALGGQVQMIYMDPPYGVKFGSNFQPFVRKRDVKHNDDADLTREPEMVKAYRDTWELGLHSYLTYLRDRLLLCRELLTSSGSIFVQISDENLHHVRELLDEVFGAENFVSVVSYVTTSGFPSVTISRAGDYVLWYARDLSHVKYRQLFRKKSLGDEEAGEFKWIQLPDGTTRSMTRTELAGATQLPEGARPFRYGPLTSSGGSSEGSKPFVFDGKSYNPGSNNHWKVTHEGLQRLAELGVLVARENSLAFRAFLDSYPVAPINNVWNDTKWGFDAGDKAYVVQTNTKIVQRCVLMTTDPGDLVLDPTCGSGTTAYVAEQWGRRWITIDTSRVPLALARQRLLTATFPYYELADEARGPAGGFVYRRKQNSKGEEVGGIVPHVTLKSIANNEPPEEEVLVDRPEEDRKITRVTGPFCVEATIPTPVDWEADGVEDSGGGAAEQHGSFVDRMLEVLRRSPVLHVGGGKTVTLKNIRQPAKTLSLSAEALVNGNGEPSPDREGAEKPLAGSRGSGKPVAVVFGPENGAISEKLVYEAAREAHAKAYTRLYVVGFAIQANARKLVEECEAAVGVPATYVTATPDLMMGDLLKNMRSSEIFSVCGLPEIALRRAPPDRAAGKGAPPRYQVELVGLDVFDPVTMELDHRRGDDVPGWFLDTDYNGLCFHVCQAFFPRTSAWESLKKALRGLYAESVWDHLAGTVSAPFEAGEHGQVAVKVIDDRGNELMVVQSLREIAS